MKAMNKAFIAEPVDTGERNCPRCGSLGVPVPSANAKVEGALLRPTPVGVTRGMLSLGPDGFFDGQVFDPALIDLYIAGQRIEPLDKD